MHSASEKVYGCLEISDPGQVFEAVLRQVLAF
jgi:hypothetical protein